MRREFTGWHMLLTMLGFFGMVIAVNLTMAVFATRSFSGTVVDNGYVASQHYNRWLAEARAQRDLGWHVAAALDADRHLELTVGGRDGPVSGAEARAEARHPLGRLADTQFGFAALGDGRYRSLEPLPDGRWNVHFDIRRGADRMRLIESIGG